MVSLSTMDKDAPLPRIVCINGSLRGRHGNSGRVVAHLLKHGHPGAYISELCLADIGSDIAAVQEVLLAADGFIFCSGVYWNSHGSILQRFIEVATAWEATDKFWGKPASVVLTMDSVGGMEVAARLLGVLNLLGCTVPPLATVVLSRAAQVACAHGDEPDVYTLADADILVENMVAVCNTDRPPLRTWPVKPTRALSGAYPQVGALHLDREPWLIA